MWIYYDTETTGVNHPFDQILQIAAVVTSNKWQEFESINYRCSLRPDVIPAPEAVLITRQKPSDVSSSTLKSHYAMMSDYDRFLNERILSQKDRGGDINGYERERPITFKAHNIKFDDTAYRHNSHITLHNPYIHMMDGCARFDTMKCAQAIAAYAPDAMSFTKTAKGNTSFKLGELCEANGISVKTSDLHDALVDVRYTVKLDQKMNELAPKIHYQMDLMATKQDVAKFTSRHDVFSYCLYHYGKPKTGFFTSIPNEEDEGRGLSATEILWDLSNNPEEFFNKDVDELADFFAKAKKGNSFKMGSSPTVWFRRNEQPILMPMDVVPDTMKTTDALESEAFEAEMKRRAQALKNNPEFIKKLNEAYRQATNIEYEQSPFPQEWIYESFPDKTMKEWMTRFHKSDWATKKKLVEGFDKRFAKRLEDEPSLKRYKHFAILLILDNAPQQFVKKDPVWKKIADKFAQKRAIAQLSTTKYISPGNDKDTFKMTLPYARMRMQAIRDEIVNPADGAAEEALKAKYSYQDKREILPMIDSWLRWYDARINDALQLAGLSANNNKPDNRAAKQAGRRKKTKRLKLG